MAVRELGELVQIALLHVLHRHGLHEAQRVDSGHEVRVGHRHHAVLEPFVVGSREVLGVVHVGHRGHCHGAEHLRCGLASSRRRLVTSLVEPVPVKLIKLLLFFF